MSKKCELQTLELLVEHQSLIRDIRSLCERFVNLIRYQIEITESECDINGREQVVRGNGIAVLKRGRTDASLLLSNMLSGGKDNASLASLLKIGQFLIKLIPLEHKVYGTCLIKDMNCVVNDKKNDDGNGVMISEADVCILQKFLENKSSSPYLSL
ncbi:hypothetical protein MIDIC_110124 [Alphaproteobacteria bacterium]